MCKLVRKAERMAENTTSQRGMDIISCVLYIVHPGTLQWQVPESFPEGSRRFPKVPEGSGRLLGNSGQNAAQVQRAESLLEESPVSQVSYCPI